MMPFSSNKDGFLLRGLSTEAWPPTYGSAVAQFLSGCSCLYIFTDLK